MRAAKCGRIEVGMEYLLIEEAAVIARVPASTIRYWIRLGKLQSSRPGRRRLIASADLEQFLSTDVGSRGRAPGGYASRHRER